MDAQGAVAPTELVRHLLPDRNAGWSIATSGASAEFQSIPGDGEAAIRRAPGGGSAETSAGALRVTMPPSARPVAYEVRSERPRAWRQLIAFCVPATAAVMAGRSVVTELGPDVRAIRRQDRETMLFDLGIGAPYLDFCIRTADRALIRLLRRLAGQSLFVAGSEPLAAIRRAGPHRVCLSRVARVEVYQPIVARWRGGSLLGPHTHLVPERLGRPQGDAGTRMLPKGWVAALTVHLGSPVGRGRAPGLDAARHHCFQELLERYGPPGYMEEKMLITAAVLAGMRPAAYPRSEQLFAREAARIALRQMLYTHPEVRCVVDWLAVLDEGSAAPGASRH